MKRSRLSWLFVGIIPVLLVASLSHPNALLKAGVNGFLLGCVGCAVSFWTAQFLSERIQNVALLMRLIAGESRVRAANRQRIIPNLQNQERMANPDKYRNISTDQIPYDYRKISQNESFIAAVKAGLIAPTSFSKEKFEVKQKQLFAQLPEIVINEIIDQRKKNKLRRLASNQGLRPTPTPNVSSQISQYPQEIIYGFSEDGRSSKLGYMGCGGVAVCEAITQQLLKDKLSFKDCIRKMSKHMISSSFFYRKEYNLAI